MCDPLGIQVAAYTQLTGRQKESPEALLSKLFRCKWPYGPGPYLAPDLLFDFVVSNWSRIAPLAHAIHARGAKMQPPYHWLGIEADRGRP